MSSVFKTELKKPLPIKARKSKIQGMGVFATRNIGWGKRLIQYTGELIDKKESERREKIQDKKNAHYIFLLNNKYDIDASRDKGIAKYINHSCDPNCIPIRENNEVWIFSMRNITKGEELSYDYDFYDKDSKCNCGSEKCRGYM